jgi:hypothetical protein
MISLIVLASFIFIDGLMGITCDLVKVETEPSTELIIIDLPEMFVFL